MSEQGSLERRQLGKTGISVPVMGFGSAPLGGFDSPPPEEQCLSTIRYAFDQGIDLFDSAPLYGKGRSERLIGRALEGIPRDQYLLSTKVGRVLDEEAQTLTFDFSRDGVMRSLEGSLRRLQTDRLDILHIHDPDDHLDQALDEAYPVLDELRRQGVTRAVGAGMNQWEALARFAQEADFDCFLLAGRYTLLEQYSLDFLRMCQEKGIGILLGGVFNSGILATGSVAGARYNYAPAPPEIMEKTRSLETVTRKYEVPLNVAALQFAKTHPAVSSLVLGAVHPGEVADNLAGLGSTIPAGFWEELVAQDLLDPAAPLQGS